MNKKNDDMKNGEQGARPEQNAAPEQEKEPREETPGTEAAPEKEEAPAPEPAPGEKKSKKEKKKTEAELLQEKLDEANDKYLRMLAEYDNYRRRSQEERKNVYAEVRADTVKKLLPVYDNLLRAVQQETSEEARKGMDAILTQFRTILSGIGVTEIEAVGKRFDPALHEALLHIDDEKYGESEIVMELEKGFMLGDRVIRFSKVQVAN